MSVWDQADDGNVLYVLCMLCALVSLLLLFLKISLYLRGASLIFARTHESAALTNEGRGGAILRPVRRSIAMQMLRFKLYILRANAGARID